MKKLKLAIIIGLFSLCSSSFAKKGPPYIDDFFLGIGNLTELVGHVQVDESGKTESFDFNPYFLTGMRLNLYETNFAFEPEFGLTLPHEGRDPNTKKWSFNLLAKIAYHYKFLALSLGTGFYWVNLSSDGGTKRLQNGDGYSDFPIPEGSSTSQNLLTTIGLRAHVTDTYSANFDAHILNLTDELSRSWNYVLSINYHFGKIEFKL
ncbi:hypothetical protein HBN50_04395 [Halobacteriovorax sp. GB3]|uniref:hypothetical protein n=1 Tax=Halobacteriovorax sp. GB3 TaxID=2719615 RepID=UPI00235DDCCB|nr:hypothetical protein [Halobacteriovorax sp. GB3]MDD0852322.1 hypothetical protein [Halobacteriovorax sp. GB3]